jgi:hypothetical protein
MNTLRTVSLALCLVVGFGAVAVAQDAPEATDAQRSTITFMLSGYEYFPTRADLEAVTPAAPQVLAALSQDEAQLPSLRVRAIDALGLFSDDPVAALHFEGVLATGGLEETYLRHSLTSSLKAFGPRALPWVEPYLAHADVVTRVDAAYALQRFGGDDGVELLRLRKSAESDPFVRGELTKLVSQGVPR